MGEGRECVYVGVCMSVCGCVYILESVDEGLSKRMTTANRIALSFPVQSHKVLVETSKAWFGISCLESV